MGPPWNKLTPPPQNAQQYSMGLTHTLYHILCILGLATGNRVTWAASIAKCMLQPRMTQLSGNISLEYIAI